MAKVQLSSEPAGVAFRFGAPQKIRFGHNADKEIRLVDLGNPLVLHCSINCPAC
jgi:hypothetical protein